MADIVTNHKARRDYHILDTFEAGIALREILEDKIGWEMPELTELVRPQPKKRRKK